MKELIINTVSEERVAEEPQYFPDCKHSSTVRTGPVLGKEQVEPETMVEYYSLKDPARQGRSPTSEIAEGRTKKKAEGEKKRREGKKEGGRKGGKETLG